MADREMAVDVMSDALIQDENTFDCEIIGDVIVDDDMRADDLMVEGKMQDENTDDVLMANVEAIVVLIWRVICRGMTMKWLMIRSDARFETMR